MREEYFVRCGRCGSALPFPARDGDVCGCRRREMRPPPVVEMARLSSPVDADGAPVVA